MSTSTSKAEEAAGDSLPAYTDVIPSASHAEAPPYAGSSSSAAAGEAAPPPPDYRQASFTPYVPIPNTLLGVSKTAGRGVFLCSEKEEEEEGTASPKKLFYSAHHSGLGRVGPLGGRAGVQLHNGLDSNAFVLAASASPIPQAHREDSAILPPPMMPTATEGVVKSSPNYTHVPLDTSFRQEEGQPETLFRLRLDVGAAADRARPATFAWCKLTGADAGRGFRLVRRLFRHGEKYVTADSRCAFPKTAEDIDALLDAGGVVPTDDGEVVAVLWSGREARGGVFKLEMRGSAAEGTLGERCRVMIVVTALGVHYQNTTGGGLLGALLKPGKVKEKKRPTMAKAPGFLDGALFTGALI